MLLCLPVWTKEHNHITKGSQKFHASPWLVSNFEKRSPSPFNEIKNVLFES